MLYCDIKIWNKNSIFWAFAWKILQWILSISSLTSHNTSYSCDLYSYGSSGSLYCQIVWGKIHKSKRTCLESVSSQCGRWHCASGWTVVGKWCTQTFWWGYWGQCTVWIHQTGLLKWKIDFSVGNVSMIFLLVDNRW